MIREGIEFSNFIKRQGLPQNSENKLIETTKRILNRTDLLGGEASSNCQLVVGQVQSGKTMSFTALVALAHDNGFPIVVVLAGTKNILLSQTADRLRKDLKADGDGGANPWVILKKLTKGKRRENSANVQKILSIWTEKKAPDFFKPTVVITCLKNRESIEEVIYVLNSLRGRFDVNDFPVLIVDDEGDQAGLNLHHATDEESPIYAAIKKLRNSLARHSYVMYTATPQGPLLISIEDTLSPKYVTLLEAGSDYLGGEDLFYEKSPFVKYIPNIETAQIFDTEKSSPIPPSLKKSVAFFLLALFVAQKRSWPKPISMLVHPHSKISSHLKHAMWVNNLLESWSTILQDQAENLYQVEKEKYFIPAEAELGKTYKFPKDWDLDIVLEELRWWISKIQVRVVNSKRDEITPDEWKAFAGWIVIGGNSLERGFTIENLAVTYMPRSTGVGNVDVIQQRGRFFGYKKSYQDLLRGWFFQDKAQAYFDYVLHEKSIRGELEKIDRGNGKLSDWRRRFLLDPAYNPVRKQVISMGIFHKSISKFKQQSLFHPQLQTGKEAFIERLYSLRSDFQPMPNDPRTHNRNYFSSITVEEALELLADWPMAPDNRAELSDIVWALRVIVDEGEIENSHLILMDWNSSGKNQYVRERSMLKFKANPDLSPEEQRINNLWQGPTISLGKSYPGDAEMFIKDSISIQVHRVLPIYEKEKRPDVVALGLIVPTKTRGILGQLFKDARDFA